MEKNETPSEYKLHIKLLNERLPHHMSYTPALLAHIAYKGIDSARYSDFQKNVWCGNKNINSLTDLFTELETFDHHSLKTTDNPSSILKSALAKKVAFNPAVNKGYDPSPPAKTPGSNDTKTFDWKGQRDLSSNQVGFILRKFHKGCPLCRTNEHEFPSCPVIKNKWSITKQRCANQPNPEAGTACQATSNNEVQDENDLSNETTPDTQGKLPTCNTTYLTTPGMNTSLSSITTSDQLLTTLPSSTQGNQVLIETESKELDQPGSFRQEMYSDRNDPYINNAMRICSRDNASIVAPAQTAFVSASLSGLCMGKASTVNTNKYINTGFA
jgi:hypothetical protein